MVTSVTKPSGCLLVLFSLVLGVSSLRFPTFSLKRQIFQVRKPCQNKESKNLQEKVESEKGGKEKRGEGKGVNGQREMVASAGEEGRLEKGGLFWNIFTTVISGTTRDGVGGRGSERGAILAYFCNSFKYIC